jgi:hypothetical protein
VIHPETPFLFDRARAKATTGLLHPGRLAGSSSRAGLAPFRGAATELSGDGRRGLLAGALGPGPGW